MFNFIFYFLILFFILIFPRYGSCKEINITFIVKVPKETPKKDHVYIFGNCDELANWQPNVNKLDKINNQTYKINISFKNAPKKLEFKFTRGSNETIECSDEGFDILNRVLKINTLNCKVTDIVINCEVKGWKDIKSKTFSFKNFKFDVMYEYEFIENFKSKFLELPRHVMILLPKSYKTFEGIKKRYPVLYMHDGNNLFDSRLAFLGVDWGVDEAIHMLQKKHLIPEIIVVGIFNTKLRLDEYSPIYDENRKAGKLGEQYTNFIINELKPFIDNNFRTTSENYIGGSSLGGLISLYIGLKYKEIFKGIFSISPALYWGNGQIIDWVLKNGIDNNTRLWIDMGTHEGKQALTYSRKFINELKNKFPNYTNYKYCEYKNAKHNEMAWRKRFPDVLKFMFK